jgi:peptide/nickel transport system ATP-binding protein
MVLDIANLSVKFDVHEGTSHVLDGVSISVDENEIVALVGESGSGKSVTARSVLGTLSRPPGRITSGEINYHDQNLLELSEDEHASLRGTEIGLVPQDPLSSLNPVFTIGEQMIDLIRWRDTNRVGLFRYVKNKIAGDQRAEARETAIEILEQVQIPEPEGILDRYPTELSGGMRQRVLIAMALVGKPDLLIADEPTTALDVTITEQILDLLQQNYRDEGMGVLYITHNLAVARQISDKICVMYGGRIVESGPTEGIFADPKHPYTQGLIEAIPTLDIGVGRGLEGEVPNYTDPPNGCRFKPRCPEAMPECGEYRPVLSPLTNGTDGREVSVTEAADIEHESVSSGASAAACFVHESVDKTEDTSTHDNE